jgi:hypothetical protein
LPDCVDLTADPANCGACDAPCAPGEECVGGECRCGAPGVRCHGAESCCAGTCRNLSIDPAACGACDRACAAGQSCVDGECVCPHEDPPAACSPGLTCCGHLIPDFAGCVDTAFSTFHCGGCNRPCLICIAGICTTGAY